MMFNQFYEKFKKYCTEWDYPTEELTYNSITKKQKSYFTIDELCKSKIAQQYGINNTPSEKENQNLQILIDKILDPLRRAYGKPIIVNSGYRSATLNYKVKGAKNSNHLYGYAADITGGNRVENKKLWDLFLSLNIPFTELIDEKNISWIHIAYNKDKLINKIVKL